MVSLPCSPAPVCRRNGDRIIPSAFNLFVSVTWQLILSPCAISYTFILICFSSSCYPASFLLLVHAGNPLDKICDPMLSVRYRVCSRVPLFPIPGKAGGVRGFSGVAGLLGCYLQFSEPAFRKGKAHRECSGPCPSLCHSLV